MFFYAYKMMVQGIEAIERCNEREMVEVNEDNC